MGANSGFKTTNTNLNVWWDDKYVAPCPTQEGLASTDNRILSSQVTANWSLPQIFSYMVHYMDCNTSEDYPQHKAGQNVVWARLDDLPETYRDILCEILWAQDVISDDRFGMDQRGELATALRELVKTWTLAQYAKVVQMRRDLEYMDEE